MGCAMKFAILLTRKHLAIGCLSAGALAAAACSDGRMVPTSPSASAAVSSLAATAPSVAESSPRSGALRIEKECSQFDGTNGTFCTITSSSLKAIEVGSRVVYATVNGFGDLDSDVVLDLPGPGNNAAFGHCTLTASVSRCTFSGGTGQFTHFNATVDVSYLGGPNYGWEGTYSFSPK